jgi:class 3 adenylate cyclase
MSEFPGDFHFSGIDNDEDILDEIEEFLTGTRQEHEIDRVLKTVVFTDIVGSTDRAVRIGDRRWRALLDAHDSAVRREVERFRGQEVRPSVTGFSPASTDLLVRSVARGRSPPEPVASGSRSELACTPANARRAAKISPAWPCTSGTRRRSRRPRRGARHKHCARLGKRIGDRVPRPRASRLKGPPG